MADRPEFRSIARQLAHRRDQLTDRLISIEQALEAQEANRPSALAGRTCGSTRLASTIALAERELWQVEWAIGRIRTGYYGSCEQCGAMMPVELLRRTPHRVLCERCGGTRCGHESAGDGEAMGRLVEPIREEVGRAIAVTSRPRSPWHRSRTIHHIETLSATVLLSDLRTQLAQRFVDEMDCGGLRQAIEHAPRYFDLAQRLGREHGRLLARVDRIVVAARGAGNSALSWKNVDAALGRVTEALVAHQRADDDLCGRAFREDLGGGS